MAWLSPAYPVGAFSYSGGIEWAVEAGDIKDAETLRRWLAVMIGEGGGFCDAVFFVHAHRAIAAKDDAALARRRRARRGLRAVQGAPLGDDGARPRLSRCDARGMAVRGAGRASTPRGTATGRTAGCRRRRLRRTWHRLRTGAARLSARADGELDFRRRPAHPARPDRWPARARRARAGRRRQPATRALKTPLDEVGSCAFRADIASMRHETQYTRLFRS